MTDTLTPPPKCPACGYEGDHAADTPDGRRPFDDEGEQCRMCCAFWQEHAQVKSLPSPDKCPSCNFSGEGGSVFWNSGQCKSCRIVWQEYELRRAGYAPDWLPTPENVNALPGPVRKYVHDVETLCDPAGIVARNTLILDQNMGLVELLRQALERMVIFSKGFTGMHMIANEAVKMAAGGEIAEFICSSDERIPAIRAAIDLLDSDVRPPPQP